VRIVLLGPPGAGKGSLAFLIHKRLGVAHVSTGEIFRHEIRRKSALGVRVQRYVANGRLVPTSLVVEVMAAQLGRKRLANGFVLDGFPRTQGQAAGLDRVLTRMHHPLDGAVYLTSPAPLLVRRLSGRRVCARCGANYHIRTMKPKRAGRCDNCRGALITRKDDQPATIRRRLRLDLANARPLLTYYKRHGLLYKIDGVGHIEQAYARAVKLFTRKQWIRHCVGHDPNHLSARRRRANK